MSSYSHRHTHPAWLLLPPLAAAFSASVVRPNTHAPLLGFFRRRFVSVSSSLVRAGEWFSGEDAVSLGLANELVAPEELMPRALEVAVALTEKQQAAL